MTAASEAHRDPDHLRTDLDELRGDLGETVEELTARLDVPSRVRARGRETVAQAQQTARQVRGVVAEKAPAVDIALRERPGVVAAVSAGAALLLYGIARRSSSASSSAS
ncbi:DUF3618 domain-containing protein [Pseudonocardia bannensis]|uniref:DUF3618 domain-containing protein n=1 Tax=Pseudonocardia bannensis TaxID=630973 RepID=A0A848DJ32_9PSEU|nr:DUF3618 domain-containing protein [Pseudonocardia bannensis]NMH92549.1 DUF3618 domain-containing protein [Pseudonocardia bannensis]